MAKLALFSVHKIKDYKILFQKSILEKMKLPEQKYSIFFKMRSSRFLTDKSYPNPNFDHEYKIKIVSGSDCYEGFLNQEDMVNLRSDRWTLVQVKQSPTSSKWKIYVYPYFLKFISDYIQYSLFLYLDAYEASKKEYY